MLKQRVWTGIIGGAGFLSLVWWGGFGFTALIFFLATVAIYEWLKMNHIHIYGPAGLLTLAAVWVILSQDFTHALLGMWNLEHFFVVVILLLIMITVLSKNEFHIQKAGYVFIGILYIAFAFRAMWEVRNGENGLSLFLFILFTIWATDIFAYFVGKNLGRRKLWPVLSPNKTVEGSIAGLIGAVTIGLIFSWWTEIFSYGTVIMLSILIGITGQVGDLFESAVKRHFNTKDSGSILPGHGGILDRFDSLIAVYLLLYLLRF